MSLLYEVRGLVRRYGRVTALDLPALGVDELRIHSGQVLTLVGYNGSGKSTLLRLLAFLEEPDEGRIIYHGGEDPRREVSLLLQEPYLLKTTVFENVVLGLKLRGRRGGLEDAYRRLTISLVICKINEKWYHIEYDEAFALTEEFLNVLMENDLLP